MLIKFLLADILNFHSQLEKKSAGVRDLGLIESAVNSPFQTLNDFDVVADENALFEVSMGLAAGKISSVELSEWLKCNSVKIFTKERAL